jgi:hypothetical protein
MDDAQAAALLKATQDATNLQDQLNDSKQDMKRLMDQMEKMSEMLTEQQRMTSSTHLAQVEAGKVKIEEDKLKIEEASAIKLKLEEASASAPVGSTTATVDPGRRPDRTEGNSKDVMRTFNLKVKEFKGK